MLVGGCIGLLGVQGMCWCWYVLVYATYSMIWAIHSNRCIVCYVLCYTMYVSGSSYVLGAGDFTESERFQLCLFHLLPFSCSVSLVLMQARVMASGVRLS